MSRFGCPRSLLAWCPPFLFLSTASKRVRAIGALDGSRQRWWARSGCSSRRTACPSVNSLRPVTMSAARDAAETETPEATAPTAATDTLHTSLRQLQLQATFTAELPADPERKNFVRAVSNAAFTHIPLQAAWPAPELIAWSHDCAVDCFDLRLSSEERALAARVFSGMELLPGSVPYAQRYGGHQFGTWAGQLGDGRAISLGEYVNRNGQRWEPQLKGAGQTPYSRFADGRAVLRSSVREFLVSEALHHLGIPTTRALSLVGTGESVVRDMFYSGDPREEPGAIVCRVAPSWIRFGTFELPALQGEPDLLQQLADYCIRYHFPELRGVEATKEGERVITAAASAGNGAADIPDGASSSSPYVRLLLEVARRTARLVAQWQSVGFVHGVLNTDNMSILGLTMDYGPFGFLDAYAPDYTPNTTDLPGRRYCFAMQPTVGAWNVLRLAEALQPLWGGESVADAVAAEYLRHFQAEMHERLRRKLGFGSWREPEDPQLVHDLYEMMAEDRCDFTRTWRALLRVQPERYREEVSNEEALAPLAPVLGDAAIQNPERQQRWAQWIRRYCQRALSEGADALTVRGSRMRAVSPKYILRNYMAQQAIDRAEQHRDYSEIDRLLQLLRRPYDEQPEWEREYDKPPPAWAQRLGVCMNSCSS
ncbi:hypothetical protein CDCA_CDCA08G2529 [Cyanidium caldarium]|uniref:Selenoprotein O n=1 Tax=Cyanidium caldarium TaxID=2771 RepID=A0AAV9IW48_CYACA|nr:hypothetical protein CDCA_CDCA08G2529 [Cyanidium caldarium]